MNTPTAGNTRSSTPRFMQSQIQLHRQFRRVPAQRFRNVRLPRRGLLFDSPPSKIRQRPQPPKPFMLACERDLVNFFPRLFKVNEELTRTLLYGHFQDAKWLDCDLSNIDVLCLDFTFKDICFVDEVGWAYLEYSEEVQVNNVEKKSFPFQHFHWWFNNVRKQEDKHICSR